MGFLLHNSQVKVLAMSGWVGTRSAAGEVLLCVPPLPADRVQPWPPPPLDPSPTKLLPLVICAKIPKCLETMTSIVSQKKQRQ